MQTAVAQRNKIVTCIHLFYMKNPLFSNMGQTLKCKWTTGVIYKLFQISKDKAIQSPSPILMYSTGKDTSNWTVTCPIPLHFARVPCPSKPALNFLPPPIQFPNYSVVTCFAVACQPVSLAHSSKNLPALFKVLLWRKRSKGLWSNINNNLRWRARGEKEPRELTNWNKMKTDLKEDHMKNSREERFLRVQSYLVTWCYFGDTSLVSCIMSVKYNWTKQKRQETICQEHLLYKL